VNAMNDTIQGRRVLLVEDEYFIAEDLRRSFADAGADILGPVPTAARALELFDGQRPVDAAVLDINLRGEMVYPLVDKLLAAGVPTVFVTGYDAVEIPEQYRHIARCEKPTSIGKVIKALGYRPS
jgi:CheY-like chemotaxis protein